MLLTMNQAKRLHKSTDVVFRPFIAHLLGKEVFWLVVLGSVGKFWGHVFTFQLRANRAALKQDDNVYLQSQTPKMKAYFLAYFR